MTEASKELKELEGRVAAAKLKRFQEVFFEPMTVKLTVSGYWLDGEWANVDTPILINPDGTWSYA